MVWEWPALLLSRTAEKEIFRVEVGTGRGVLGAPSFPPPWVWSMRGRTRSG